MESQIVTERTRIAELEAEVERLERLLMTETPIEERREEALKVVKRYSDEYRNLQAALEKIKDSTKHAKYGHSHDANNLANIHEIAEQALKGVEVEQVNDLRHYMVKCSEYRRRIIELEAQFKEDQYERDKFKILKFDLKEIAGGLLEAKLKEKDQLDQLRQALEKIIVV
jgi:hypothetical protein